MSIAWKLSIAAASVAATSTAAAAAGERVHVAPFSAVAVAGGGRVTVRPTRKHEVRIVRGDLRTLEIRVSDRQGLKIRCRPNACRGEPPHILVGTPSVTALAVEGSGSILVAPGFADQKHAAGAVRGGGQIDMRNLRAHNVAASVDGGGSIFTGSASNLAATVKGGGVITYRGTPRLASVVRGGGDIRRAD